MWRPGSTADGGSGCASSAVPAVALPAWRLGRPPRCTTGQPPARQAPAPGSPPGHSSARRDKGAGGRVGRRVRAKGVNRQRKGWPGRGATTRAARPGGRLRQHPAPWTVKHTHTHTHTNAQGHAHAHAQASRRPCHYLVGPGPHPSPTPGAHRHTHTHTVGPEPRPTPASPPGPIALGQYRRTRAPKRDER
jgi:hypothetical protein